MNFLILFLALLVSQGLYAEIIRDMKAECAGRISRSAKLMQETNAFTNITEDHGLREISHAESPIKMYKSLTKLLDINHVDIMGNENMSLIPEEVASPRNTYVGHGEVHFTVDGFFDRQIDNHKSKLEKLESGEHENIGASPHGQDLNREDTIKYVKQQIKEVEKNKAKNRYNYMAEIQLRVSEETSVWGNKHHNAEATVQFYRTTPLPGESADGFKKVLVGFSRRSSDNVYAIELLQTAVENKKLDIKYTMLNSEFYKSAYDTELIRRYREFRQKRDPAQPEETQAQIELPMRSTIGARRSNTREAQRSETGLMAFYAGLKGVIEIVDGERKIAKNQRARTLQEIEDGVVLEAPNVTSLISRFFGESLTIDCSIEVRGRNESTAHHTHGVKSCELPYSNKYRSDGGNF